MPTCVLFVALCENEIRIDAATASKSTWKNCDPNFRKFWLPLTLKSFDITAIEVGRKLHSAADQAD